ncbi:MAG TPA: thioredoxin domain-containing protein [Rhizomicrobium sp.]|nr:thioredoxin domain-containing protein [Rhizomicrobium sp.]
MSRKQIFIALGVLVLIVLAGIGYYVVSGSGGAAGGTTAGYEILPADKTLGNPKSKVVLIEYAAPSCPVCAAFNSTSFGRIKANYIDTGKIFYVFRVFPIAPEDGPAEKLARCLPEDKYFPFIDLLFRNQPKWDHEYGLSPDQVHDGLILMARIAGVSADQANQCMSNKAEDDRINKVASEGESRYSITGTPTFILNGVSQGSGNIPYETLAKLLDTELAKQH